MKPRILIAEDNKAYREDTENLLQHILPSDKQEYRIEEFVTKYAEAVTDGEKLLKEARKKQPFDILLLDLDMPDQPDGPREHQQYKGFRLLRKAKELGAALEVVIVSGFSEPPNILEALRGGASDFIDKSLDTEEKQMRILSAWRRALEKRSDRLLDGRVRQLIPYDERAVAHYFTPCFSDLVQEVVFAAEGIERYAVERYNLDPERDSQDSLMQSLSLHNEAVKKAQKQWRCLQSKLSVAEPELTQVSIEKLLEGIQRELEPCLMIKETKLLYSSDTSTKVQSFQDDIAAVLREIVAGALSELANHGRPHRLQVTIKTDQVQKRAEVRFRDDLDPISQADADTINGGLNLTGDRKFGRLWGLQVTQQIVMLSGGRLQVEPDPERPGNVVICFIPLA